MAMPQTTGFFRLTLLVPFALLLALFLGTAAGQQIHRNGFESNEPAWVKGPADAAFKETAHRLSEEWAHTGRYSELIQLQAESGTSIHYLYDAGRAPLGEQLTISLELKANRPGMQLMARLVLPHERNKDRPDEPLTTLLRGDIYQQVSRWQRLELRRPVKLAKDQQQLLRAELNKDIDLRDAYVDRIVLNLYGGPGLTEVWIDDLEAGPTVEKSPFRTTARPAVREAMPGPAVPRRAAAVLLKDSKLLVGDRRFFFRAIRHSDTPLKTLRDAGFNTVWFDGAATSALVDEAINLGFWVVPALSLTEENGKLTSGDAINRDVARYLEQDGVLFWDVGAGGLAAEQAPLVNQAVQLVKAADPQRPIAADVWDGFRPYSLHVGLLGVHRWPLMTGLELSQYRDWLNQRRLLAYPGTFVWTWVQTHLPDWHTQMVYDKPNTTGFSEPVGPQPEQIRLLTYTALSAGCRGLGFWSDRFLADSHQGRDRLLALALLNQELQLLEPLLVTADRAEPAWIDTSVKDIKAAVLRTERGVLVLPIWMGNGSQYVPGQAAAASLTFTVPDVPTGTQAWEVSPAEVRALRSERVVGGTKVTIPEFGLTAAVVFTGDHGPTGLLVWFQEQTRRTRRMAAQWAHDLAATELDKVTQVHNLLSQSGHSVPDADNRLNQARTRLQSCMNLWNSGEYGEAYHEAERALRPLRILMRAEWELAIRDLNAPPVASPYAVNYFTLPRHWAFLDQLRQSSAGTNLLADGDFELPPEQSNAAWQPQEVKLDEVDMAARRVTDDPKTGRQCLLLQITPRNPQAPPKALERTFLALSSPAVRLQPGSLVRVSGWMKVPKPIVASADGAMLFDSAGGEPLAVRQVAATPWRQFTLYRRVPANGQVNVTLGLTGIGAVYFDDVRIEPLSPGAATAQSRPVEQR